MPSAPDKFSYLLDDNNQKRDISDLAVLNLNENYFDTPDSKSFTTYTKALYLEFHPDKNPAERTRATEAFKYIREATGRIQDNIKRNGGKYVKGSVSEIPVAAFDFEASFGGIGQFLQDKAVLMQHLKLKAKILSKKPEPGLAPGPQGAQLIQVAPKKGFASEQLSTDIEEISDYTELAQVIAKFKELYRYSLVTADFIEVQDEAFREIEAQAQTGNEFYLIAMLQKSKENLGQPFGENLLKAASLGHILAIRQVIGYAFLASYTPLDESIRWSLDALHTLQTQIIPRLAASSTPEDKAILEQLQTEMARTLVRIGIGAGAIPVKGTPEYDKKVQELVVKLTPEVSLPVQFSLKESAEALFRKNATVDFSQPLKELSRERAEQQEKAIADRQAKEHAEQQQAKERAERQAKERAERQAREAERKAKEQAERQAKEQADGPISFPEVVAEFKDVYKQRTSDEFIEQYKDIFNKLQLRAQTAGDFYLIAMLQKEFVFSFGMPHGENLLKAASLGHILATSQVIGYVFSNVYTPLEQSVRWGLDAINTMINEVMPRLALSAKPEDHAILKQLLEDVSRTLVSAGLSADNIPPKVTAGYEQTVKKLVVKISAKPCDMSVNFSIKESAESVFIKNATVDFSLPLAPRPAKKPDAQPERERIAAQQTAAPPVHPLDQAPSQPAKSSPSIDWNQEGAKVILEKLEAIGKDANLSLAEKKQKARETVVDYLPHINSNHELLKLSELIEKKKSPAYAYLRQEQDVWRLNKHGNTNTWNAILGAMKKRMDHNVDHGSKDEHYTKEEYEQFMTIMNEHRGRGLGSVTHSKLYKQLEEISEDERQSINITKKS